MNRGCVCLPIAVFTLLTIACVFLSIFLSVKSFTEECGSQDGLLCQKSFMFCPEDEECLCLRQGVEFEDDFGDDFEDEFGAEFGEGFGETFGEGFGLYTCKKPETNWFTENGATMALVCGILAPVFLIASILSCVWFCCAIDRDETRVIMAVPATNTNILRSDIA